MTFSSNGQPKKKLRVELNFCRVPAFRCTCALSRTCHFLNETSLSKGLNWQHSVLLLASNEPTLLFSSFWAFKIFKFIFKRKEICPWVFLLIWRRDPNKVSGKTQQTAQKTAKRPRRAPIDFPPDDSQPSIIRHYSARTQPRSQQRQQQDEKIVTQVESHRYGRQNVKKPTRSDALSLNIDELHLTNRLKIVDNFFHMKNSGSLGPVGLLKMRSTIH